MSAEVAEETTDTHARSVPLLIAAGVLVIVVVAGVLLFGVHRPPALESVADQPDPIPPAAIAWSTWEGERGHCLSVAQPDGNVEQTTCLRHEGELVGFLDDGVVMLVWGERQEHLRLVDHRTGETLEQRVVAGGADPFEGISGWDPGVDTSNRDGVFELIVDGVVIWSVDAPPDYDLTGLRRSPDGTMIVGVDRAERVLVFPVDGSAPPRVWATGVDRWQVPMWQGATLAAWELATPA